MKAIDARAKAVVIAEEEIERKLNARNKRLKKSIPLLRKRRIEEIEKDFRDKIRYAVENGNIKTEITLSENHHDRLRGRYKYLPINSKIGWRKALGEDYLKYAAWGKYVKIVITRLRRDGYTCVVSGESVLHDDSAAYANSGGEVGSEEIYYTQNTILRISW